MLDMKKVDISVLDKKSYKLVLHTKKMILIC